MYLKDIIRGEYDMIKKIRKNKLAVSIIAVILAMIIVFAVNFGIVNFVLWLLQFIVAKPLAVTLQLLYC